MSPITHFFIGWALANSVPSLNKRERALVTWASVVPDLDGLGIVADRLTRNSAHPLNWWGEYHHTLCHNLGFAIIVAAIAAILARQKLKTTILAFISFHLHLIGDLVGARGPDGDQWPIPYLLPFSRSVHLVWSGQWALNAWPNMVITAGLVGAALIWARQRGFSPLEMVSSRLDAGFVRAIRARLPLRTADPLTAPSVEMTPAIPPLDLTPGATFCLHIPHECNEADELVEISLLDMARRQAKSIQISRPAARATGFRKFLVNQSSAGWLARSARISISEAEEMIASLGVRVADDLAYNAGTERCLLGLSATFAGRTQVVAYSTSGLDVEGCRTVHHFVASRLGQMCAVHISHPSVFGDGSPHPRQCPPGAQCIELACRNAD